LSFRASDFIRLLNKAPKLCFDSENRPEHNHPIPEAQLRVGYGSIVVRYYELLFEAEILAEPFDCGWCIAVA
jgi:hypothetical protein